MFDSRINRLKLTLIYPSCQGSAFSDINTAMKLTEIINLNKPQVKVEAHSKSGGNPRTLLLTDINTEKVVEQIKEIVFRISSKYITGNVNLKLIDTAPLAFNMVPDEGNDFYRFVISLPAGMDEVQKGLITAISSFNAKS